MSETAVFLLECIAGISILCCVVYFLTLARKSADERANPFKNEITAKRAVTVRYEGKETAMSLYLYEEGLTLERSGGERLCIPVNRIVRAERFSENGIFSYKIIFTPDQSEEDMIEITSETELTDDFAKVISAEKFSDAEKL